MRGMLLISLVALSGCGGERRVDYPKSCSAKVARSAAIKELNPILKQIIDPKTREAGCENLDSLLRNSPGIPRYNDGKPDDCSWDYGDDSPYGQAKKILEPQSSKLSELCDWKRKDAERELQRQGEAVLQGLSPEDRQAVERAWQGQ